MHADARTPWTHPHSYARVARRYLRADQAGRYLGRIDFIGHRAIVHDIRLVSPRLRVNSDADSHRCSGAHVAVYLVAIKYMFHTSSLLTPQNRLWLILSTVLLLSATASEALQIRWSWSAEWRLGDPGPPANLARIVLSVQHSVSACSFGSTHASCRLMVISWISDCILVSVPHPGTNPGI